MLARLQRGFMLFSALGVLAWVAIFWGLGHPWLAAAGVAVALLGYTVILAFEFVLLACVHRDDPTPRASVSQLLRAWMAECVVAAQVFGWRQPFRSSAVADVPGRAGVRGVVFVHGYLCNRGLWNPWLERCQALQQPCIAVNLEPVFSELDAYVPIVEAAVTRLERETGLAPLLVCHSMGGLVARAWLASAPHAQARMHHVITIGTPHRGTWLARLSRTANALHMRPSCDWLCQLRRREPPELAAAFTCLYSHADNIVMPPAAAVLPGSRACHVNGTAHVALAFHPAVMSEVWRWLPTGPPASRCTG